MQIYSIVHNGRREKAMHLLEMLPDKVSVLVNEECQSFMLVKSEMNFDEFRTSFADHNMIVAVREPTDFRERYPHIDF